MSGDEANVLDMLLAAQRATELVEGHNLDEFMSDWKTQSALQHQLMILGEAVKRLSPEFRDRYPQFPWAAIAGHRDILIHHYNGVDLHQVWIIATKELPPLLSFLESIAPEEKNTD